MNEAKILVIEDEIITAMDIQKRLQKLGYAVPNISATGNDAIMFAEKSKPDLILMDIVLKGKPDGIDAAKVITRTYHIPVVFLTAYSDEDTFNRAKLSLPYGYLTKPFETRDLRIAIELALFKKNMEMKLAKAEDRYRMLMENASCGIFIYDKNGIVQEINKQGESIFGYSRDHMIGKDFRKFVVPEEQEYAALQIQKLIIEKKIGPNEGHIVQPSGLIVDVVFSAISIDIHGENILLCILNNMTEYNQLHTRAVLNDKLATVGTLTAGIIHEINNPLTWLLGNIDLLQDEFLQLKKENINQQVLAKLDEMINDSLQGAKQIRDIVSTLKGFSRLEDKELFPVDIHSIINDAIKIASTQFKNHPDIQTIFAPDLPLMMFTRNKLLQVFLNLIINAHQSLPENNLNNNSITISTTTEDELLRIDITDSGIGIKPEDLPKIFESFYTTKPAGIGTGLGLSICSDIVSSMGGKIDVKSVFGSGTTFTIHLPISLNVQTENTLRLVKTSQTRKHILIVDDEPFLLKSMQRLLEDIHDITTATGGRAALTLLEDGTDEFDTIISDLNMPDINGADLYRYVAEKYPGFEKNIIFMTGSVFTPALKEFLSTVNNLRLTKPINQDELLQAIERMEKK